MLQQGTSVLIADRDVEVRQALRLVCEESLGLTVVGEVGDSSELLTSSKIIHLQVLFLEWDLPGMETAELIQTLRRETPLKIIVFGGRPEMRIAAQEAGVDGFIYKGSSPTELISLLQTIIQLSRTGFVRQGRITAVPLQQTTYQSRELSLCVERGVRASVA